MTATGSDVFTHNTGIVDEEVEAVRAMIGEPLRIRQFNVEASIDSIRHYAHGLGDDNPLWCDEDYGRSGPYGTIVAPPTFLYAVWAPGVGPGFPGLQAFHAGGRWEFERPVKAGERIIATARMTDLQDIVGRRAGRMLLQIGETEYRTPAGELVGKNVSRAFRIPRPDAKGGGLRYEPRPPQEWSDDELEAMEHEILAYQRQGSTPLLWDDVEVGTSIPERLKCPLDLSTMISYYAGNLSAYQSTDMAVKTRHLAKTDPDKLPNNRPAEIQAERTAYGLGHHNPGVAAAVGMPGAYDNGWMRIGWIQQALTDWIGDHGRLEVLDVSLHLPNTIGDTLRITGEVTAKRQAGNVHRVDLRIQAARQDGEISCRGTAAIRLQ